MILLFEVPVLIAAGGDVDAVVGVGVVVVVCFCCSCC